MKNKIKFHTSEIELTLVPLTSIREQAEMIKVFYKIDCSAIYCQKVKTAALKAKK